MGDKEYIEQGALIKRLEASPLFDNITKGGLLIKAGVIDLVRRQPAADVVEVRHGEWREDGDFFICSNCGYVTDFRLSPYCPNRGAKMDGKGEGG